jgi:hypothetical protein
MTIEEICKKHNLLRNREGVIRIPFLVKGGLVIPPEITRAQVEKAFSTGDKKTVYAQLPGAQIVREPIIDRQRMTYTGEYIYQVMPIVSPTDLIETDTDKLVRGLYALSVDDILDYLDAIQVVLAGNNGFVRNIQELYRLTAGFPDAFLDYWFRFLYSGFDRESARQMIDNELLMWGKPGSEFLNGWVDIPAKVMPGSTALIASGVPGWNIRNVTQSLKTMVRAMPTRQLHITAGNAPEVPLASILRAILTKSAAAIKLPYGATLPGALVALAATVAAPEHPLTKNLSVVYWQGGDRSVEDTLFSPNAFDRIVVWGSPETVTSVQSRALFTRTVFFNPRYGVSMIGKEAFTGNLAGVAERAATDAMIYNQRACTASLVQYVEGTGEEVRNYAELLQKVLASWDSQAPNFVIPSAVGQIRRMRRGRYSQSDWYLNEKDGRFTSGVVVMRGEFDILDHPMCRFIIVRPVANLTDALKYLNQNVSTVGIYPEERRTELRDRIAAKGVSDVFPLGECERMYPGMPHDGMPVLSELVDWKNA